MKKLLPAIFLLFCCTGFHAALADALPRELIALYDSRQQPNPRSAPVHRYLEMPANYLGYDIHYYDVGAALPAPQPEVAGVVLWFAPGYFVPDAEQFMGWIETQLDAGKKLIIIDNAGFGEQQRRDEKLMRRYNRILARIGLQDASRWNAVTYAARIETLDNRMAGFERPIGPVLPPFQETQIIPGRADSHLHISLPGDEGERRYADLIVTSPGGGYVAEGYALFEVAEHDELKIVQWFINPFEFLRSALNAPPAPVPDITTLGGRRIFYSHIDGDGWNNVSEIEPHAQSKTLAAEVVRQEILAKYNDFAFTVGLIGADVDPQCYGVPGSEEAARAIYALPNVEPSSHTHSHPLFWGFFDPYDPAREAPLLDLYPPKPKTRLSLLADWRENWENWTRRAETKKSAAPPGDLEGYVTPRSYVCNPFSLPQEIEGSAALVNRLSPAGKTARLIQWSGDTSPFAEALAEARKAGLYNINGGDSRFDSEYPSYASIAPIGLRLGGELQIYSSNSNENTYTNLWTARFFGFRYLKQTVENTESPIRLRPFNLYFHMYSGEKQASLNAVRENMEYARSLPLIPIATSDYAAIANGFYSTRIEQADGGGWRIGRRGALSTLRMDNAQGQSVDFSASKGVLGQRFFQGSLYIALDPAQPETLLKLKKNNLLSDYPTEKTPYLLESRWAIKGLHIDEDSLIFEAFGYGPGEMTWKMPRPGTYTVRTDTQDSQPLFSPREVQTGADGTLNMVLDAMATPKTLRIIIEKKY